MEEAREFEFVGAAIRNEQETKYKLMQTNWRMKIIAIIWAKP